MAGGTREGQAAPGTPSHGATAPGEAVGRHRGPAGPCLSRAAAGQEPTTAPPQHASSAGSSQPCLRCHAHHSTGLCGRDFLPMSCARACHAIASRCPPSVHAPGDPRGYEHTSSRGAKNRSWRGPTSTAIPQQVALVSRSAIQFSWYLLNIPYINFISFSFLIQNIALHYIQFIKKAKYFTSHVIAFISQTTPPVASHQLIFHRHILIVINCVTSPYLRIRQVLHHSFILQGWQTYNYSAHFTFSHCHQLSALIIQKVPMDRSLKKVLV